MDLLVMVDPELRSNLAVTDNVALAIHISNGGAQAHAMDATKTTVINLNVPSNVGHTRVDNLDLEVMDSVKQMVALQEQGALTVEKVKQLAGDHKLNLEGASVASQSASASPGTLVINIPSADQVFDAGARGIRSQDSMGFSSMSKDCGSRGQDGSCCVVGRTAEICPTPQRI